MFADAIKHRPRIRLTIRPRSRVIAKWPGKMEWLCIGGFSDVLAFGVDHPKPLPDQRQNVPTHLRRHFVRLLLLFLLRLPHCDLLKRNLLPFGREVFGPIGDILPSHHAALGTSCLLAEENIQHALQNERDADDENETWSWPIHSLSAASTRQTVARRSRQPTSSNQQHPMTTTKAARETVRTSSAKRARLWSM